jgi:uncharacterized protein (TIGR03086 family)
MELITLHRRALENWVARVAAVRSDQWDDPTPCTQWSVRDLVNHVVAEDLWTAPLLGGKTIAEVGSQFDGDVLGKDPLGRARMAAEEAKAIVEATVAGGGRVHLSYGQEDMGEYVRQLCADHLIHGWDLAAATGGDTMMDPELVADVGAWFAQREPMYRGAGLVSSRPSSPADPQSDLLAGFGRTAQWGPNHAALASFSAAFGSGDVDAIMAAMSEDCVFESTGPAPDGQRHVGQAEVRAVWEQLFGQTRDPKFTNEDAFVSGDRACVRWRFTWTNQDGSQGHVRGVDVMQFRDGLVSEKLSYVKG